MTDIKKSKSERLTDIGYLRERIAELENRISSQDPIEHKLRESEAKYRLLIETLYEGIWRIDAEGYTTFVNPKMAEMLGYSVEEMNGQHLFAFMGDEELANAKEKLKSRRQGISEQHEFKFRKKNGEPLYVLLNTSPIFDDQGRYAGALASLSDITERTRMEQSLKESERNLERAQSIAHVGSWRLDLDTGRMHASEEACRIYGLEGNQWPIERVQSIPLPEYRAVLDAELKGLIEDDKPYDIEFRIKRPTDGAIRHVHSIAEFVPEKNVVIGVIQDVTDRKKAEEKAHILLKEKEILLREVHHRIKNNMTAVESLINLQASRVRHEETKSVLRDVKSRLQSMRVMYDKLYLSDNFTDVSVKGYLSALVDEVVKMYPEALSVEIKKEIEDFTITAEKTFSLGILINELITNSMKYAFAAEKKNILRVAAALKNKRAVITIQDNGPGIPESIDLEHSKGFGLQLVNLLAQQIGGAIRIERKRGTAFILEFEV